MSREAGAVGSPRLSDPWPEMPRCSGDYGGVESQGLLPVVKVHHGRDGVKGRKGSEAEGLYVGGGIVTTRELRVCQCP